MARRIRLGGVEIELIARSGKAVANLKKLGAEVQRQTRIQKALRREYYRSRRQVLRSVKSMISLRGAVATLAGAGGLGLLVTRSVAAADAIGKKARGRSASPRRPTRNGSMWLIDPESERKNSPQASSR